MFRQVLVSAALLLSLPLISLGAQTRGGLTKVQLLALQQQMRDEGCGNKHAAGAWDAETRRAIRTCAKKYNTKADARALLQAMNVGFSPGENPPMAGAAAMSGDSSMAMMMQMHEKMMKTHDTTMMKMMYQRMMQSHDTAMMKMMHESMMKTTDPAMIKMHESMMKSMHDSLMKSGDTTMIRMHEEMMKKMQMKHDSTSHF